MFQIYLSNVFEEKFLRKILSTFESLLLANFVNSPLLFVLEICVHLKRDKKLKLDLKAPFPFSTRHDYVSSFSEFYLQFGASQQNNVLLMELVQRCIILSNNLCDI